MENINPFDHLVLCHILILTFLFNKCMFFGLGHLELYHIFHRRILCVLLLQTSYIIFISFMFLVMLLDRFICSSGVPNCSIGIRVIYARSVTFGSFTSPYRAIRTSFTIWIALTCFIIFY